MTSARLRESLLARIRAATGENWRHQLVSLRAEAYACNAAYEAGQAGAGLTTDDVVAVEAALQDRAQRMEDSRQGHEYRASVAGRAVSLVEDLARTIEAGSYDPEPEPAQVEAARPTSVPTVPRTPTTPRRIIPQAEAALRAARIERRRWLARVAGLPAAIAQHYTTAQQAVWGQILIEIQTTGSCELAVDALAHRARVSRRVVQSTRRKAADLGHLAVVETVRAPNRLSVICSTILDWLSGLPAKRKRPSQESRKTLLKENLTHPQQGAKASTLGGISPPEALPEPAPVEVVPKPSPEPVPAQALPEAAVGACEPTPVVEVVRPAPPPPREPDMWDRILTRVGLPPRGCQTVAEPGAG